MHVIYKYPLKPLEVNRVEMPYNCKILTVGFQVNELFLWAAVDTDFVKVEKLFYPVGTGIELSDYLPLIGASSEIHDPEYIGTAVSDTFVWHVFHLQPIKH